MSHWEAAWGAQDVCLTLGKGHVAQGVCLTLHGGHKMFTSYLGGDMGAQDVCLTLGRGMRNTRCLPHIGEGEWGHNMFAPHWKGGMGHNMFAPHLGGGMAAQYICLILGRSMGGTRCLPHIGRGYEGHTIFVSHWGGGMGGIRLWRCMWTQDVCLTLVRGHGSTKCLPHTGEGALWCTLVIYEFVFLKHEMFQELNVYFAVVCLLMLLPLLLV